VQRGYSWIVISLKADFLGDRIGYLYHIAALVSIGCK